MKMVLSKTKQEIEVNDVLINAYSDVYGMDFDQASLDGLAVPILRSGASDVEEEINKALQETIEFSTHLPGIYEALEQGDVMHE